MCARFVIATIAVGCLLAGCGGDDGGGGIVAEPVPAGPRITISGTATYDRVPVTAGGLDYAATTAQPIRGAVVQVRSPSGATVWFSAATDDVTGAFAIEAPASSAIRLVVLASLGTGATATKVTDAGGATYALAEAFTTAATDQTMDLHAASGWGGSGYTATRAAAPFAILDTIHDCRTLVRGAEPAASFPGLRVQWTAGGTTGTYYSPSQRAIYVVGRQDVDTDEYDEHVVAHEWGHYYEDTFARSDSIGGPHSGDDILDERVAFGEGFGNAFSGMATRNAVYRDTNGAQQGSIGVLFALEPDAQQGDTVGGGDARPLEGVWSEPSVQELLWDIYDGGPGALPGSDGDAVALGFPAIHAVLTGPQRTTAGFTTILSFLHHLKLAHPGDAPAIAALATAENILDHDEFDQTGAGRRRHTTIAYAGSAVTVDVDVDGDALTTYETYGPIDADYPGNKLYNWLFFRVTAPSAGTYRFRVEPLGGSEDLAIIGGGPVATYADAVYAGTETLDRTAAAGEVLIYAVGSFDGAVPFRIRFGTAVQIAKPSAGEPAPPVGDG